MNVNDQKVKQAELIKGLNAETKQQRIESLKTLLAFEGQNGLQPVKRDDDSNTHIHTIYSFSPY